MKGPSNNIQPLYPVAEKIANTGSASWIVAGNLEPTGDSGYGFQLINDADGTYQWSTQFGISNGGYNQGEGSSFPDGPDGDHSGASASGSAWANNGTVSSTAMSSTASPTGYSNSSMTSTDKPSGPTGGSSATLLTTTTTGSRSASASSSSGAAQQTQNAAVSVNAMSFTGAFAAIMAAVAAL
jgi:hypothetical protein